MIALTDAYAKAHAAGWKSASIKSYAHALKQFEEFLRPETEVESVTPKRAEELKQWLLALPGPGGTLSSRTVAARMALYGRVWDWAMRMDFANMNPFKRVSRVVVTATRERMPFTPEEVASLLDTAKSRMPWFFPLLLTMAVTGSRRGPIPQMLVRDFDPVAGTLRARDEISKKGKGQVYPLPGMLKVELVALTEGRDSDSRLFLDHNGRPFGRKLFDPPARDRRGTPPASLPWYRLQALAGVKPRGVHNLRRAAVSNLAAEDVTMEKITSVTGQTPEVARDHYLSLSASAQRETMEKLATIYGVAKNDDAPIVLKITRKDADCLVRHLVATGTRRDSGTESGTTAPELRKNAGKMGVVERVEEREGFEPSMGY